MLIFYVSAEASEFIPYKKHTIYGMWENDKISFIHTDRNYTNGIRFGYTSKEYDYFTEDNLSLCTGAASVKALIFCTPKSLSKLYPIRNVP